MYLYIRWVLVLYVVFLSLPQMVVGTVPPEPFLETTVINVVVEDNIPFGLGFQISYLNWCLPHRMFFTKPSTFIFCCCNPGRCPLQFVSGSVISMWRTLSWIFPEEVMLVKCKTVPRWALFWAIGAWGMIHHDSFCPWLWDVPNPKIKHQTKTVDSYHFQSSYFSSFPSSAWSLVARKSD